MNAKAAPSAPAPRVQTPGVVGASSQGVTLGKQMAREAFIRAKDKREAARAEQEAEPAQEEQPQEESTPVVEQSATDEAKKFDPLDTRWERARRAFKRAGIDPSELKGTRDQIIRRGLNLQRAQDDAARDRSELELLRKKEGQSSTSATSDATPSRVPASTVDLDGLTEPFAEEGEEFRSKVKGVLQGVVSPLLERIASLERAPERTAGESSEGMAVILREARAKAAELIPALADDDEFREVSDLVREHKLENVRGLKLEGLSPVEQAMQVILAGARLLGHDTARVGARTEPTDPHGAAGRGFLDVTTSRTPPRAGSNLTAQEKFVQNAMRSYEQFQRTGRVG